jgi:hypothetical protein
VTTAEKELRKIQDEVTSSTAGILFASVDIMRGTVQLGVTYDDGALQAALNERYAEGVVTPPSSRPSDPTSPDMARDQR